MIKAVVTGAAGFIGSHLCERLLSLEHQVVGLDCFTEYYSPGLKRRNVRQLLTRKNFTLRELDLCTESLEGIFEGADFVFHLAAQPGVRSSWGKSFETYVQNNIIATQRLLEQVKETKMKKLIFASSSSVYGNLNARALREDMTLRPVSPYGVTKLASERLAYLYWENFGVPCVLLRFFSVFGPRQRPDMAFQRLIEATLNGSAFTVYGDGTQTRDFTFVADVVQACIKAAVYGRNGEVYNVGGGNVASVNEVIAALKGILRMPLSPRYVDPQKGDVAHTCADIGKAKSEIEFIPVVSLSEGLRQQIEYHQKNVLKNGDMASHGDGLYQPIKS
jgi:nucleoside-diphosphate-sugar epimerase